MSDMAAARRAMVDGQVRTADVTDLRLIAAMLAVPRERFVPATAAALAYFDRELALGPGRALLKPMVIAKLIQAAAVEEGDRVLEVGCGTGYVSALLARLAGSVIAVEEDPALAQRAAATLAELGAGNVTVTTGPLEAGWPAAAPYDVILLNGATEVVPQALGRQLKPDGRLLCVLGRGPAGKAMLYRPSEDGIAGLPIFDAAAPVLPGFAAPPAFVF